MPFHVHSEVCHFRACEFMFGALLAPGSDRGPVPCRYGPREDYRRYVATTPVLLPFMKPFYINNEPKPFDDLSTEPTTSTALQAATNKT